MLKNKFENLFQNESLNDAAIDKIASSLKTLDLLKKVIANLLLISRIENNQYQANETIDCFQTIEDLALDLEDRMEAKSLRFSNELKQHFYFKGNATLMHILLYNLIVNAIKYTQENGIITVSDEHTQHQYKLTITDTGVGMDVEQLEKIFKRFTRISEDKDGHGLGLAIVESIAHFHQIVIEVTSIPMVGSTFALTFPKQEKPIKS